MKNKKQELHHQKFFALKFYFSLLIRIFGYTNSRFFIEAGYCCRIKTNPVGLKPQ